jgi:predicted Zn-dependent peptidase
MVEYQVAELANGLRLVHKQVLHTQVAHCGIMLDIGSRDENADELGIAHFWEHMAFKGTKKRKSFHILNRIDAVGGELNAYTTKEKICFHASVLVLHIEKAIDLLADITFNSTFPEKEIEKEKMVILEEMSMYLDSPEDAIQDEFDEVIFGKHPLGINVLGSKERVSAYRQSDFIRFVSERMSNDRIILSSVNNLPFAQMKKLAEKYLGQIPVHKKALSRQPVLEYTPKKIILKKPISGAHCMIGRPAFSLMDERRIPFFMLNNLLGGPGMNSRLNLGLREKYGWVYSVDSNFTTYTDTGLFSIYFGSDPKYLDRCAAVIYKEMKKLSSEALTPTQLAAAKEQIKGQLAMSEENNMSLMLLFAKSILDLNEIESLPSIFQKIDAITSSELLDMAKDMFNPELFSTLTYVPE